MKLAIIGTGKIVHEALFALEPVDRVEVVAIFARPHSKEKAEALAEKYGIGEVYTDYDELLAKSDAQAVYIGLVNSAHFPYAKKALLAGKDVILDIEVQGAEQIHALRPEVIRIFIAPPSWEELERRLVGRATEDAEKVRKRLARSRVEFPIAKEFNYIVVNHTVEQAVGEIKAIMAAEHCRAADCYDELFANL